ncbi:MAG: aminotransferase class V-fold PLP-dependent enzyme [Bacteroidia bacterium]|nr:aminotransferase class V-fold PLP-dependent enzyme [Bacteroidia bacterium]
MKELFLLNKDIVYLNFGSFGACPREIFEDYIKWQYVLEAEPVQFITTDGANYIRESAKALAQYIHCNPQDLVFVPNPTHAINIIAKNLNLLPNDEVLTTDLEYGAMDRTFRYYCQKANAKYIRQHIQLPLVSKQQFIEDFCKGFSSRTKVVFISHITSSTALIFPVKEICEEAKKRGITTIVDGAHVPGHISLNISDINADYYTGACHKWMMTPKGCSFLHTKNELQNNLDPLIISWGYDSIAPSSSRYWDYHQFNGTRDFSAYLTLPKALAFMQKYHWENVANQCHLNLMQKAPELFTLLQTTPLAPLNNEFMGQMVSAEIKTTEPEKLQRTLFEKHQIEIPIMRHDDKCYIRISYQAFNNNAEIDYLYKCLHREINSN